MGNKQNGCMSSCRSNSTVTDVPAKKTVRNSKIDKDKLKRSMRSEDKGEDQDSKDLDHYYLQSKNMITTMDDHRSTDNIKPLHIEDS